MNDDITNGLASYKYGLAIKYEESRPLVKYNYVFIIYYLFTFFCYLLFIFVTLSPSLREALSSKLNLVFPFISDLCGWWCDMCALLLSLLFDYDLDPFHVATPFA